jgi:hypothetical protein
VWQSQTLRSRTPQRLTSGRPILARVPTRSPFVSLRRLSATILPLTAMPLTTPFLPLSVSAADLSSSASSSSGETTDIGPETELRLDPQAVKEVPATATAAAIATATTTPAPATRSNSRRLTFNRFPLLRKGSRELTRATSAHFRGSSISAAAAPPSRTDSPFLPTGAPRASRTSFARGRTEQPSLDLSTTRDRSASASLRSGSVEGEEPGTPHDRDSASLQPAAHPAKMHQTSSRLLRMTDDERPYTRVSALLTCTWSITSHPPATPHCLCPNMDMGVHVDIRVPRLQLSRYCAW